MTWITDQNLDPKLQDWGEAYKELCAIINAKLPEIKHIDLYYGQDQVVDQDGNWVPFRAPAIFMEFAAPVVSDLGDNTQQLTMDITMYLCMQTVQDTNHGSAGQRRAMEFIGVLRKMHMVMHGAEGDHFSPLSRVGLAKKADAPPYMYMYGQTYRCVLLDNSTSKQYDFLDAGTLGLEIEPYSAPPITDDHLVVVRNTDNTYSVEVTAPGDHLLPNVVHTDSNGAPRELPAMTPMICTPAGPATPGRAILYNSNGDELDSVDVPAGEEVPMSAPDVLVMSTSGLVPVAMRPGGDVWALPKILLRYYRGGGLYALPAIGVTGNDSILELDGLAFQARPYRNAQGLDLGIEVALDDLVNGTLPRVPSASVQRRDSAGNAIGSPITAPPGPVVDVPCPDGAVLLNGVPVGAVRSNGTRNIDVLLNNAPANGAWTGSVYNVSTPARVIRQYTGAAVWTKPAGLRELFVLLAGGGGGGAGAGRRAGAVTGASGGGGGMVRWVRIDPSSLSTVEFITIGAGGAGGLGTTATAGTVGGDGSASSFGAHLLASGGLGGQPSASSGLIPGGAGGTLAGTRYMLPGAAGGNAQSNAPGAAGGAGWSQLAAGAGGGAGGASTNTPQSWAGGNGGGVFEWNGLAWELVAGPTGPAANGGPGADGDNDQCLRLLQSLTDIASIGLGTGGAGGAGSTGTGSAAGNKGGNGGRAAGGGGGGAAQGGSGGNGGNGGPGFCILIEIY